MECSEWHRVFVAPPCEWHAAPPFEWHIIVAPAFRFLCFCINMIMRHIKYKNKTAVFTLKGIPVLDVGVACFTARRTCLTAKAVI